MQCSTLTSEGELSTVVNKKERVRRINLTRRLPFITFFGLALWEARNFKVKKFYRGIKGFQYRRAYQ